MFYKLNDKERNLVTFLDVPFSDKDKVISLGAVWDKLYRKWYVPENIDIKPFENWFGKTPDFNLSYSSPRNPRLFIDLVPQTSFASNLSQQLPKKDWDNIRKSIYASSNYVCEICGCVGPKGRIDAHERWHYDDKTGIQSLIKISSLCPNCHLATHMGFAKVQKKGDIALAQLAWVNMWGEKEALEHEMQAFKIWRERSKRNWETDVTWIFDQNFILTQKTIDLLINKNGKWFIDKNKMKMKMKK